MSNRQERMAQNEAASRRINEEIEQAHDDQPADRFLRVVCECARATCERVIAMTLAEYGRVRSAPRQFAVVKDHVVDEAERRVEETDRFVVVAKREGDAADVARAQDPRG